MSDLNASHFEHAAKKAVKEELRGAGWPVYKDYEVVTEDGDAFVVAPVSHALFFEAEPREVVVQEGVDKGSRWQRLAGRDPAKEAMTFYAPLGTPELVLELAELAEREITPRVVLEWAQVYGLLGFPDEDFVGTDEGFVELKVNGMGRRDRVQRFTEAAGEIRACLRIFEAVTSSEDVPLEELLSFATFLPRKAFVPFGPIERHAGKERSWLLRVIGRLIQMRLDEYCFPQFAVHTNGGIATGKFSLAWGFKGLIGALWLHMAWLLDAEGQRVKRCKLPGCLRVIHFDPGDPVADPGLKKNVRGKYKTRSDREFCKGRGCKQKYHYRKKAGWNGYS
jgi:hypothetical protein